MVRHVRIHGRGGEGVKLASRIVSRAAFLAGLTVQDSPLYGAERRGAPVVSFARFSDMPIGERGYIDRPDAVVLMDQSLLAVPEAAALDGLDATSLVLVNSTHSGEAIRARYGIPGRVVTLDVSSIAIELLGRHVLSAPIAGFTAKAAAVAQWELLAEAVRTELHEIFLPGLVDSLEHRDAATHNRTHIKSHRTVIRGRVLLRLNLHKVSSLPVFIEEITDFGVFPGQRRIKDKVPATVGFRAQDGVEIDNGCGLHTRNVASGRGDEPLSERHAGVGREDSHLFLDSEESPVLRH